MHIRDIRIGMKLFCFSVQRKAVVTSFGQVGVWLDGGTSREFWADPSDLSLLSLEPQSWGPKSEVGMNSNDLRVFLRRRVQKYMDVKSQCPSFRSDGDEMSSVMGTFSVSTEQKFDPKTSMAEVREKLADRVFEHMYGDLFDSLAELEERVDSLPACY